MVACGLLGSVGPAAGAPAGQSSSVTGVVSVVRKTTGAVDNSGIALWLKPVGEPGQRRSESPQPRMHLKIAQRNKQFEPRLLVVPVGSQVDFPNLDPFFHNVFSLYDGQRFDLGLYEAGTSRRVPFSTPGIYYIFCNIHPDMSAVVVAVDTPYFAMTNRAGEFAVPNVPPGRYALSVWHERDKPEHSNDFPRDVMVSAPGTSLGAIHLIESDDVIAPHKNKYGHDYVPPRPTSPIYKGGR